MRDALECGKFKWGMALVVNAGELSGSFNVTLGPGR